MKRARLVLIGAIVITATFVVLLATRNRAAPPLPDDPDHYSFFDAESCMLCHAEGRVLPQGEDHPLGDDCLRCHPRPAR